MAKDKDETENVDIKRNVPTLRISCKDCLFLKNAGAYRNNKGLLKPCEDFGTIAQSDPCKYFVPNTRALKTTIGPALAILSQLQNPDIAFSCFYSARRLKQTEYAIGQKIFFHVLGGDYLNNYASGYIIGYVQDVLIIEGSEGHISQIKPDSNFVLTEDGWNKKLASLLKANKINDPKGGLRKIFDGKTFHLNSYTPPMLSNKKKNTNRKPMASIKKKEKLPKIIKLR